MSEHTGEPMDHFEIEQFLGETGLGVLGLARDGRAYTFPIAFAYDGEAERCILRFVMGADSEKRAFVSETREASLTTYEWSGTDDWRSVVLRGPIEELSGDELSQAAAIFSDVGEEAALDVFNEPISEFRTAWYELQIEEMTGRGRFG